jgi:hypothetical protein
VNSDIIELTLANYNTIQADAVKKGGGAAKICDRS